MRSREGLTGTVSQRSQLLHLRLKVALQVPVRAFRRQIQEWLLRRVVVHDIYGAHLLLDFGHCGPLHTQALEGLAGWLVIAKPQHRFFSGTAMHASQGRGGVSRAHAIGRWERGGDTWRRTSTRRLPWKCVRRALLDTTHYLWGGLCDCSRVCLLCLCSLCLCGNNRLVSCEGGYQNGTD